jgi:ketosteroid isomerase-like protein
MAAAWANSDNAPVAAGNETTMRRLYAALVERDLETVADLSHPEIEYRNPPDAIEPGTRKGRDEILDLTETLFETFEYTELTPARFAEAGDTMAVELHVEARSRAAGVPVTQRLGHLIEFRDGVVFSIEWSSSPEAAFAALERHTAEK